jgi:hypothetical protein
VPHLRSWRVMHLREVLRRRHSGTPRQRGMWRWKCSPQRMLWRTTKERALLAEVVRTGGRQPTERSILDLEHLYTRLGIRDGR